MNVFRQGDVLMVKVGILPKNAVTFVNPDENRVVLAYGEVTGHAHAIAVSPEKPVAKLWDAGAERFLQVIEKTVLRHEEHAEIEIDPGVYRVVIQKEYTPKALRNVAD